MKSQPTSGTNYNAASLSWTEKATLLEREFAALRISDPSGPDELAYSSLIPGIVRELSFISLGCYPQFDRAEATKDFTAIQRHADRLLNNGLASAKLTLKARLALVQIANMDAATVYPTRRRGAPSKNAAKRIAEHVALHYQRLTGRRPTRHPDSDYMHLLAEVYKIMGVKANPDHQAKTSLAKLEINSD